MANYPTSLPSSTPASHGVVKDEMIAIATELGLNPSGSDATVVTRLDNLTSVAVTDRQRCTGATSQTSSTTYSVPTGFAGWTVTSGKLYRYEANILYTTAATTTGLRASLSGPSMTDFYLLGINQTTTTAVEMLHVTAIATDLATTTGIVAATHFWITGTFIPSATAALNFQFRSEVNASQVQVQVGSYQTLELCA